jgi:hypothetical protein
MVVAGGARKNVLKNDPPANDPPRNIVNDDEFILFCRTS